MQNSITMISIGRTHAPASLRAPLNMSRRDFGMSSSYGRGGAGNINTVSAQNARIAEDLEANQSPSDSFTTASPLEIQQPSYIGRGGSGNYADRKESKHWDDLGRAEEATFASMRQQTGQARSPTYGRGGAGNFASGAPAVESKLKASRKNTEDELKRDKLQQDIEREVEERLAMPQKAKLPE